jgi:hypothetical protein
MIWVFPARIDLFLINASRWIVRPDTRLDRKGQSGSAMSRTTE